MEVTTKIEVVARNYRSGVSLITKTVVVSIGAHPDDVELEWAGHLLNIAREDEIHIIPVHLALVAHPDPRAFERRKHVRLQRS